jgi:hypothetical protein
VVANVVALALAQQISSPGRQRLTSMRSWHDGDRLGTSISGVSFGRGDGLGGEIAVMADDQISAATIVWARPCGQLSRCRRGSCLRPMPGRLRSGDTRCGTTISQTSPNQIFRISAVIESFA